MSVPAKSVQPRELLSLVTKSEQELQMIGEKYNSLSNASHHITVALQNLHNIIENSDTLPNGNLTNATHSYQRASDILLSDHARTQRERKVLRTLRESVREIGKASSGAELGNYERLESSLLLAMEKVLEASEAATKR